MARGALICLALVLAALTLQADASRARVDTVVRRMLRTEHDAPGPMATQSGGSIQSTQSGSPIGGVSVNSASSLSNSVSALSPSSSSSASASADAASNSALPGGSSATPVMGSSSAGQAAANKKKRVGGGRLTVVSNVNMMNSRQPAKGTAATELALMQETIQKGAQESRQKRQMKNALEIEGEAVQKKQAADHVLELRNQEAGQKALLLEQDTKRQVHAKAMADEGHAKTMVQAAESKQKADAKIAEETSKIQAKEAQQKTVLEQQVKKDKEIADRKEATDKAKAAAKEATEKAAQKRAEEVLKQKQEQQTKASELKAKTAEEASNKKEETAKAKYIVKAEAVKVAKSNIIAASIAQSKAYTLMFWYKPEGKSSAFTNLLHHGDDDFSRGPAIYMFPDSNQLHICSAGVPEDAWNQCVDPNDQPDDNSWTHVVVIHGAKGIVIYYNAKQVGTFVDSGPRPIQGPLYSGSPWADPAIATVADVRWVPAEVPLPDIEKIFKAAKHPA